MIPFQSFAWERPLALVLLAVPLLVLLLARKLARPAPRATGTLELWRRAADAVAPQGPQHRTRLPPALVWLASALALGVLALASPSVRRADSDAGNGRVVRVVVDRSPSMYLLFSSGGGATRLARALEAARSLLEGSGDVEWIAPPVDLVPRRGRALPAEWLVAPRVPRTAPDFVAWDEPGALWITDRAPDMAPRAAGCVASGGVAVVGPVAVAGTLRIDWDGTGLVEVAGVVPPRRAAIVGPVPVVIERMLAAWAAARGLAIGADATGELALELRGAASGPARATEVARDGWSASASGAGSAPLLDADGPLERWLEDPSTHARLVTAGPGRVATALVALDEPRGDPAAFAVSWARLLDRSALLPSGVVPLEERADAGLARVTAPHPSQETGHETGTLPVWLAALATLAAIVAAWLAFAPAARVASGAPLRTGGAVA